MLAHLSRRRPDLVRLAEGLSLAIRIEPSLLRWSRLEERPRLDVSAELDFMASPLAGTVTADWLILVPSAAKRLRTRLARDETRLHAAWRRVSTLHENAPPTVQFEESLLWLEVSSPSREARANITERLDGLLGRFTEDSSETETIARWFAGRFRFLPEIAQETPPFSELLFLVSHRLGGRRMPLPKVIDERLLRRLGTALRGAQTESLWVSLSDQGELTIGPEHSSESMEIQVPRTDPLLLGVTWDSSRQIVTFRPGETHRIDGVREPVEIVTAAGRGYRLRRKKESPIPADWVGALPEVPAPAPDVALPALATPVRQTNYMQEDLEALWVSEYRKSPRGYEPAQTLYVAKETNLIARMDSEVIEGWRRSQPASDRERSCPT